MKKQEKNPYATPSGGPQPGKTAEWDNWNREQYLQSIWRLPIEERRERAIARQAVQRRWDAEAGNFYNDEEHERRLLELMQEYRAIG